MSKSPKPIKHKTQKDLIVWSMILTILLLVASAVLWSFRNRPESNVHIPASAFEKKSTRIRDTNDHPAPPPVYSPASLSSSRDREIATKPPTTELQRAMELVDQGHWEQAEPILLAELERDPKNEGVLLELAMIQILDKHEPQSAQPYLESAIRV